MRVLMILLCGLVCGLGCGESAEPSGTEPLGEAPTPMHFTVIVHLEGWPLNQAEAFQKYVAHIREYTDILEEFDARFTWEASNLIQPIQDNGDNILLELEQRGQAVGLHADLGGKAQPGGSYTLEAFTKDLADLKADLEALGVTVNSVSGICSKLDWVSAAADAGMIGITGVVAYCLLSMPTPEIPAEYQACNNPAECHQVWPSEPSAQVQPWRALSGANWTTPDPAGRALIFPGGGSLVCAHESNQNSESHTSCEAAENDVDAMIASIEDRLAYVDPDAYNAYTVVWSFGSILEPDLLRSFVERIDPYVRSGRVVWTTVPEMVQGYEAWEASSSP